MSNELLRTRIGNTVTVVLPVLTRGDAVSLVGRDITIMLVDPNERKTPVSFTVGGVSNNIATFVVEGTSQTATGTYRAEVYENYRGTAMAVYDCDIFVLVARTEYENDGNEGVSSETTTLDPINIAWVGRDGYTPYIQDGYWYINGTSTNVKAAGENGDTPYIENGYWYIGGISTGIKVDYTNEEAQRAAAEQVRVVAEAARVQAEAARTLAENSRLTEESGRSAAEGVRILAERDRQAGEAMRQTNEEIRHDNEEARVEAELGRAASEASRAQVEATRVANESARTTAEATRAANEQTRVAEETDRAAAETARIAAETARETAEDGRTSAEATRVSNEQTRVSNETTRQSNESARQSAETARQAAYVAAENARDAVFAEKEATRDAANQAALDCADALAALGPKLGKEIPNLVASEDAGEIYTYRDAVIKEGHTYRIAKTANYTRTSSFYLYFRVDKTSTGQSLLELPNNVDFVDFTADKDYNYILFYLSTPTTGGTCEVVVIDKDEFLYKQMVQNGVFHTGEKVTELNIDQSVTNESNALVLSGGVFNANYEAEALAEINAKALGIDGSVGFNGTIDSSARWGGFDISRHRLFSIKSGDSIYIKAGANVTLYALFKAYPKPKYMATADLCSGQSRVSISANAEATIVAPSDAKFLYITETLNTTSYVPATLTINGKDVYGTKNVLEKFADVATEMASMNGNISTLDGKIEGVKNEIVKEHKCTLSGTSTSKITLLSPIVLSTNGDELEVLVEPTTSDANSALAFASSGVSTNNYYSIQLDRKYVGLRAVGGSWLFSSKNFPVSNTVLLRIVYADSKIYTYINGQLVNTYNSQETIRIESIGDGGHCTYGYWGGVVHYIKFKGTNKLLPGSATFSNVVSQTIYKWEGNGLPKGILSFTYHATSPYFEFYSRLGESNRYFSFKLLLDVNDSDLVYLKEWRLTGGKCYEYVNGAFIEKASLMTANENELAMHFSDKADHTGGVHGDERIDIDNTCFAHFFADGKMITDMNENFVIECESFTYFQKSTLHETTEDLQTFVSGHPIIAYHLKKNEFRDCGFHLENTVKFVSQQSVSQFFAGLMCVHKDCATYALLPAMVASSELTGTNNYIYADDTNASVIEMWNPSNDIKVRVEGHILEGFNDPEQVAYLMAWDREQDTKYYRYTLVTKVFNANDVLRNEQTVRYF